MGDNTRGNRPPPDWYAAGLPHVWLPYTQMKTAREPLPVAATDGVRIRLADGREPATATITRTFVRRSPDSSRRCRI